MKFNYYHIINKSTNKEYIGITEKTFEERFKQHKKLLKSNKHPNWILQKDWIDYGEEGFEFSQITSMEFDSIQEGYDYEYYLIHSCSHELYNLAPGGQINPMYSEPIKEKMKKTK